MFKDRFHLIAFTLALIAIQAALWPIILKLELLPPQVPFWYIQSVDFRLAPANFLWIIPAIAVACWMANIALSYLLYRRHPDSTHLLAATSVSVCFLAAAAVIKIVLIYANLP